VIFFFIKNMIFLNLFMKFFFINHSLIFYILSIKTNKNHEINMKTVAASQRIF